jgi:cell division protein FtsN
MNKSSQVDGDGYTVEVSLLKFKPVVLALSAAALVGLVSLLGWLGYSPNDPLASKTVRNNATNQEFRESPVITNNATSRDTTPQRDEQDAKVADDGPDESPTEPAAPGVSEVPSGSVTSDEAARRYAVQAGSFASVSDANEKVSILRAAGFEARVAAVELGKRGTWYRVYSGEFESSDDASRHQSKLRASGAAADTMVTAVQQ